MRGRKPKPTFLKLLDGNAGRRPLNADEPAPQGDLSDAPDWLSDSQKIGWQYAIDHAPASLLKRLDRSMLTVWVVAEDNHREAAEKVAKYGQVIKAPVSGQPMQSPYLGIMNRQAQIMMKAASELGFSPASRPRIKVEKGKGSGNPFLDDIGHLGD